MACVSHSFSPRRQTCASTGSSRRRRWSRAPKDSESSTPVTERTISSLSYTELSWNNPLSLLPYKLTTLPESGVYLGTHSLDKWLQPWVPVRTNSPMSLGHFCIQLCPNFCLLLYMLVIWSLITLFFSLRPIFYPSTYPLSLFASFSLSWSFSLSLSLSLSFSCSQSSPLSQRGISCLGGLVPITWWSGGRAQVTSCLLTTDLGSARTYF